VAFLRAVPYAIGFVLPPLVVWSALMGGAWPWLPVVVMFAGVPVADALLRQNILHPSAQEIIEMEKRLSFRAVTWLWVPVHVALVFWVVGAVVGGGSRLAWSLRPPLPPADKTTG